MAYLGILSMLLDKMNQDPFQEPTMGSFGPYGSVGGAAETGLFALYIGDKNNIGVIASDLKARAYVLHGYVCNENVLDADPLANDRIFEAFTLNVGAGSVDAGYVEGSWKWLFLTEEGAGAAETLHVQVDIHANQRR